MHTCFASQVLDAHVFVRWTCPAHFASKGHANTPGREPRFMIPGSESGCCDETGGGGDTDWPRCRGQSVSHSMRQVRADGRTSESFGRLFQEFANSHSRPEYFRRETRPSRATPETSLLISVPEEFAHAAPEHF
jgi:hypothetical protein